MDTDFIVDDDEDSLPKKRKAKTAKAAPPPKTPKAPATSSTSSRFAYNPSSGAAATARNAGPKPGASTSAAVARKPVSGKVEQRYPWLVDVLDADRNPKGHPDYDPRTLHIPKYAWDKFSPFEKQFWEIKCKLYDTVVFFKKGKFYELYEDDATIGHREFDLKLTDRVNMRMVGVPESSLDMWVAQFIAKGYKVARVDQKETALGKELRDKAGKGKPGKEEKIIRRELTCVLTAGTLVDESMLQDDMATYCMAIKVSL